MSSDGHVVVHRRPPRSVRHLPVVVSVSVMATAWAHQEDAPHGSVLVAGYEVRGVDRLNRLWPAPATSTLALAVVLRPALPAVQADALWLAGALAVVDSVGGSLAPWWPDVVEGSGSLPAASITVGTEVHGGQLALVVLTIRVDLRQLELPRTEAVAAPSPGDVGAADHLVAGLVAAAEHRTDELCAGAATRKELAEAYSAMCPLVGRQARVRLIPSGEARGTVQAIDSGGRLVLRSYSGIMERFTVDMVASVELRSAP